MFLFLTKCVQNLIYTIYCSFCCKETFFMKTNQFVQSSLEIKEHTTLNIQNDLFSLQNKTIAQLIEEANEEKTEEENAVISSG